MIRVNFILPETTQVQVFIPAIPPPGARIEILSVDYTCGQSYWYQNEYDEWIVRIQLYPPTRPKEAPEYVQRNRQTLQVTSIEPAFVELAPPNDRNA